MAGLSEQPRGRFRTIGLGRAGGSITEALCSVGWDFAGSLGRGDDPSRAAAEVDLVVIAVPDDAIAGVARSIEPGNAVIMHLAGSRPLTDLRPHARTASLHPLVSLPDPATGAERLKAGAVFAVAGDPIARSIVEQLGGRAVAVDDARRSLYHATAAVAANHLVALCAQVERLADEVGVPVEAYWQLMTATLDNVTQRGAAASLTGPAARADWQTINSHLAALPPSERPLYELLSRGAAELAGHPWLADHAAPGAGRQHPRSATEEGPR